ncbi:DUF6527 family protein [Bradyrhizobium elkanii]|uniref:DUF6527 family protein n=1 Tax=Bradyrhizobium elkanii TaxID=29448 RepID=UPI0008413955|nr:DUF6527 family protein [Bradyrhizobium elkanii]ODM77105.1 hypothetical protein A6X20_02920 [Bradyrhizobium elkanii]ODM84096.1 hypothetical protein A6452_14965 [Bradyrhizobium elkanii]
MIKTRQLRYRFVETIPDSIESGVLYVSMKYATAAHRCCCGCGKEVVTPFSPVQWQMSFDGDAVSLHPSIGNWNLRCRSHYVIRDGRVIEAPKWDRCFRPGREAGRTFVFRSDDGETQVRCRKALKEPLMSGAREARAADEFHGAHSDRSERMMAKIGFSRGAYTVRCLAGIIARCGIPTHAADEVR